MIIDYTSYMHDFVLVLLLQIEILKLSIVQSMQIIFLTDFVSL